MRELIRLLSSGLPVGKIPGIWEFIFPLLYNSLSLALYCFHTLCHKIQEQSPINLVHSPGPLSAAKHHLPSPVFLRCTLSLLFSHIPTHPLLLLLYYTPLRLIRLISSFSCNHVIRAFFPPSTLQPSHLSLFCLVSSTLMVCFYKTPKWLLVSADCMTLTPLFLLFSSHLPRTYNSTLSSWRSCLLVKSKV